VPHKSERGGGLTERTMVGEVKRKAGKPNHHGLQIYSIMMVTIVQKRVLSSGEVRKKGRAMGTFSAGHTNRKASGKMNKEEFRDGGDAI